MSILCPELKQDFKIPQWPNRTSKWVVLVTSRKLSSLATFFVCEVSGEVMVKFCQESILYRKVWSARNVISASGRVSNRRNSQIANQLEPFNGPSENWESYLLKRYSGLPDFQPIRAWKLRICSAAVLSRNRIQQRRRSSKFYII
jgi:hypothetical protein